MRREARSFIGKKIAHAAEHAFVFAALGSFCERARCGTSDQTQYETWLHQLLPHYRRKQPVSELVRVSFAGSTVPWEELGVVSEIVASLMQIPKSKIRFTTLADSAAVIRPPGSRRRCKQRFVSAWLAFERGWGGIAERFGGLMGVRQRRTRRSPAGCPQRAERSPAGSWPRCVGFLVLPSSACPAGCHATTAGGARAPAQGGLHRVAFAFTP